MSRPGPRPKPTRVKELEGNPGKRPLPRNEPRPQLPVKRPRGMGRGQRAYWDQHAPELERLRILTGLDVPAMRLMAEHYTFALEAAEILGKEGLIVKGRDGTKKNPAWQALRDATGMYLRLAAEFGMTPSARTRLQLPPEVEQLSLADLLFEAANGGEASE